MKFEKFESGKYTFPFIAIVSDNASDKPAIIFQLHGAGERGKGTDDLDKVLVHGFPNLKEGIDKYDCVIVLPQCPEDSFWVAKIESINKFVDEMIKLYNGDENRLYLCGLSMGGFGTWYTSMAYPNRFAAIAPCCGGGMPWNADVLKVPIWMFHGAVDNVVLPSNTIDMYNALKGKNENIKFDLYDGVGHDSWVKAFSEDLLKWMLSNTK